MGNDRIINNNSELLYSAHKILCALHTNYAWSLDLIIHISFQLPILEHTVRQSFQRYELTAHIAISVLSGTDLHMSQVKHWWVPCLRTQLRKNVPILRGEKHDICLKILHQTGFETVLEAATLATCVGKAPRFNHCATPANTTHWYNICTRRWVLDVGSTLYKMLCKCFVFAGTSLSS